MAWNVVIAGGGFGGLYAARRLERVLPPSAARVTLVSDENFLLYTPLLPGAAAGTLEPRHVVVPLRAELRRTDVRLGRITGADPENSLLQYDRPDGAGESLRYDHLVVAVGSVSRVLPVPGLAEHGLGFKTLPDAIALRNRAVFCLEAAEAIEDSAERRAYLSFVFVGAGYAGLEGIAELQEYVGAVIGRYPRCRMTGTRWVLVEAMDRVMPEIHPRLAAFATNELRRRGIEVRTGTRLEWMDHGRAALSDGEVVDTRTLCWTAGVRPAPVVAKLGLPLTPQGRIDVDSAMRVRDRAGVWAIGDAAGVPDPAGSNGAPCPPTAQHALRQGRLVADNVAAAALGTGPPRPFRYRTLGVFVDMGGRQAVASMVGLRLRGFPAWFAARTYHLALMPGIGRRIRLMADWTVGLAFGRDSADLGQLGHAPRLGAFVDEVASSEKV